MYKYRGDRPIKTLFNKDFRYCAHRDCDAKIKNHSFSKIQAQEDGWFFQKSEAQYCPEHIPDWVASWRAKQTKE